MMDDDEWFPSEEEEEEVQQEVHPKKKRKKVKKKKKPKNRWGKEIIASTVSVPMSQQKLKFPISKLSEYVNIFNNITFDGNLIANAFMHHIGETNMRIQVFRYEALYKGICYILKSRTQQRRIRSTNLFQNCLDSLNSTF